MASSRQLSELEGVSLGIIFKLQPCTAYRVRRELADSPSTHWQGSAGSLYPLLSRLEADKLISSLADNNDGRGRQLLKLTPKGRRLLKHWVMSGTEPERVASINDPIRSRVFFLELLNDQERETYLDGLILEMESYLAGITARDKEGAGTDSKIEHLAALGAIYVTRARLKWLREVRRKLPL